MAANSLMRLFALSTASAILLFSQAMLGGIGPLVTGMISDHLTPELGPHALARALLIAPVMHTIAALLYFAASTSFRREIED